MNAGRSPIATGLLIVGAVSGPVLRVTILGNPSDGRLPAIREAIAHWNSELSRIGAQVRLDSLTIRDDSLPDELLRSASAAEPGSQRTGNLVARLAGVPGDIVILLSHTDLISFGMPWRAGSKGVVALRRADMLPLSLPNTLRNVVAHELGHVLGLPHNTDSTTLMCGRQAPCRPAAFASDTLRFFPLTAQDEQRLRARWP